MVKVFKLSCQTIVDMQDPEQSADILSSRCNKTYLVDEINRYIDRNEVDNYFDKDEELTAYDEFVNEHPDCYVEFVVENNLKFTKMQVTSTDHFIVTYTTDVTVQG